MVHDPRVAFATLQLFGETLLPDRVSGILEMKPDAAGEKGRWPVAEGRRISDDGTHGHVVCDYGAATAG